MRSRNIKPSFFINEELAQVSMQARLLFIGLWTLADKQGVLEDRPLRIKAALFPYDTVDVNGELTVLARMGFIQRYRVQGVGYIFILNFRKHQSPHHTEKSSSYPMPEPLTVKPPLPNESTCVEIPLIPDSLIPDSSVVVAVTGAKEKTLFEALQEEIAAPIALNMLRVEAWQKQGADAEMILHTVRVVMAQRKARGDPPPNNMKYFDQPIADAIAAKNNPLPKGNAGGKSTTRPFAEQDYRSGTSGFIVT